MAPLKNEILRIADDADGVVGVSLRELPAGRSLSIRGSERFPMASVFKLPVAVAVLARVDAGKLKLDEALPVVRGDLRPRGPLVESFKPGMSVPVSRLLDDMLIDSDGSAADLLIRRLGGTKAVQEQLKALDLAGIDVSLTELQVTLLSNGVTETPPELRMTPEQLKKRLAKVPAEGKRRGRSHFEKRMENTASPEALTALLDRLRKGSLLKPPSTERLLSAMRRCRTGDARIRAGVPKGTEVWDKTGTIGRCANDVGLVRLPGGSTLAITVMVRSAFVDEKTRDAVIARIAGAAWTAFTK